MPGPQLRVPIAVVGISALFPGSTNASGFWRDILSGRDLITDVPPTHWLIEDYYDPDPQAPDKTYGRRGSFLSALDFDPLEHGVPPSNVPATDTSQLLALILAKQVLEDATGGAFSTVDRDRVSVILGLTSAQELLVEMAGRLQRPVWVKALREHGLPEDEVQAVCDRISQSYVPWQEGTFPGLLGNVVAGRIANRLDLGGTNCVTDAACASTLSAVSMAVQELRLGESDLVITGGVETFNDIFMYMCFSKTPALSPSGDCRPFDAEADGTLLGEGIGFLALRRLDDAERDGDRIYALIRGIGSSSDGRATSVYAPVPAGQAKALRRAYQAAGYGPDTVELMEAHGTGTKAGDVAEFQGLRMVFDDTGRRDRQWCALGSVKSQVGHTKAAAGAAGLLKVILALHHKVLPPTIKVDRPNPALDVGASPFHVNTEARPWVRDSSHPRRGSVSAFGFGGSNFHVTCEEYTGPAPRAFRTYTSPTELVLAAAPDPQALVAECRRIASSDATLTDLARASQERADPGHPARLAVVAGDVGELKRKLDRAAQAIERNPDGGISGAGLHYAFGSDLTGLAYLFPGQGSQYVGMGADLAMAFDAARGIWDRAADLRFGDTALHDVVFPRPAFTDDGRADQARLLTATEWAQPAIGATSVSQLALLQLLGLRPMCVGGHSFGELTALHAASVLDAQSFLRVARRRGELMAAAAAAEPGAMIAVPAPMSELLAQLEAADTTVVVANHNGPRQVVLAGPVAAIDELSMRLRELGFDSQRLPVAAAFHSPLVSGSSRPFREFLDGVVFADPSLPVYANTTAEVYPAQPGDARTVLAEQIARPVRFADQIEAMHLAGVRMFVEVGPGAVLTGLVGECLAGRPHLAVNLDRRGRHGLTSLWSAVGQLWVAGAPMELSRLWDGCAPLRPPVDRKQPALSLAISGTNYGRPYPPAGGAAALPPPNPPRTPMAATQPPAAAPEWVKAYQEMQQQTAEAHAAFQAAMAESHTAFLKAAEASFTALTALAGGEASGEASASTARPAPEIPGVPDVTGGEIRGFPDVLGHAEVPGFRDLPEVLESPVRSEPRERYPMPPAAEDARESPHLSPAPPVHAADRPAVPAAGSPGDLEQLLLAAVSDKTGFPAEMLRLPMELEGDLGIDSIKRVEILAALQQAMPSLPQLATSDIASLRTLGQIVERLKPDRRPLAGAANPPQPVPQPAPQPAPRAEDQPALRAEGASVRTRAAPGRLGRFALRAVDAPSTGTVMRGFRTSGTVVITDDAAGIAPALASTLQSRGLDARVVGQIPAETGVIVFLGGLRDVADEAAAIEVNREAFRCARAVAQRFSTVGGVFVTVQDTGGDFGLSGRSGVRAWLGGLPGLVKTAAREWPAASLRGIDIERGGRSPAALAEALADELLSGGSGLEVGLSASGRRVRLESFDSAAAAGPGVLDKGAVIVASGGARGVTAVALRGLARELRPRIALLGRTELRPEPAASRGIDDRPTLGRALLDEARRQGRSLGPTDLRAQVQSIIAAREVRATLEALDACGCQARYITADVRDGSAVAAALAAVRTDWGPITALVHGAGVLEDRLIAQKTPEQFDRVLETKILGLRTLLRATQADPLRAILLFSSIAARSGNAGQADYAMANEVMNKVAAAEAYRRGPSCLVRSLNWGPWDGGMVSPELRARFAERGLPLIPGEAGVQMLIDELHCSDGSVEVALGAAPPPDLPPVDASAS